MFQWLLPPALTVHVTHTHDPPKTNTHISCVHSLQTDTRMHIHIIHGHMYSDIYHTRVTRIYLGSIVLARDPGNLKLVQPWRVGRIQTGWVPELTGLSHTANSRSFQIHRAEAVS